MFDTLSPYSIQQTLSVCAGTLSSLEIRNAKQTFPQGHDGTCLSLAQFTCLKKAAVTSNLFFDTPTALNDLHTLLPPSIVHFTIPAEDTWLQRLAESKSTHLPRLANIDVERETFPECGTMEAANLDFDFDSDSDFSDAKERKGYSEDFKQAFRDADIKLNGWDFHIPDMHPVIAQYMKRLQMKCLQYGSWGKAFEVLGPPPRLPSPLPSSTAIGRNTSEPIMRTDLNRSDLTILSQQKHR
ncbi:MAG: hypothetical protein Q9160_009199 [Pyrenula sp. 1 TL-2023]